MKDEKDSAPEQSGLGAGNYEMAGSDDPSRDSVSGREPDKLVPHKQPSGEDRAESFDDYDDEDYDPDARCGWCGGEGFVEGRDPLWDDDFITCPSCRGSGLRKDMTLW